MKYHCVGTAALRRPRGRLVIGALAVAAGLSLAACSQPSSAAGNSGAGTIASTAPSTSSSTTSTTLPPTYVVVAGHRIKVPTERDNGVPIQKAQDEGDQVLIEPSGFVPAKLYAWDGTVVWTNLTDQTQYLSILDNTIHSGPIPPGGKFRWRARGATAFTYTSKSGLYGLLYLGQFPQ